MEQNCFDILPCHPKPEKLESLTSYLTRLAGANSVRIAPLLNQACFSGQQLYVVQNTKDFPSSNLWRINAVLGSDESIVKETTFFHLGNKFGRMYEERSFRNFLRSSIASSLRYCPNCLKDRGYYSLLWRFSSLQGCVIHKCLLLDECGHCGKTIPFFITDLSRIGICPSCKGDLRSCQSQIFQWEEYKTACTCTQDLEFLLSPMPWEVMTNTLAQGIGNLFSLRRQERSLTVKDVVRHTELSIKDIAGVEFEYTDTYHTSFQCYARYADFLCISFRDIFDAVLKPMVDSSNWQDKEPFLSSNDSVGLVQRMAERLMESNDPVTRKVLRRATQLTHAKLIQNPLLKSTFNEIVREARTEQDQRRELQKNKAYNNVLEAITSLEALDEPVTCRAISERTGLPFTSLERDLPTIRLLNECITRYLCSRKDLHQKEDKVVLSIEVAISQLKELEEPLICASIGYIVGESNYVHLFQHKRVKKLLEDIPETHRQYYMKKRDDDLANMIDSALACLNACGEKVTMKTICKNIGISLPPINTFPKFSTKMKLVIDQIAGRNEEAYLSRIVEAIQVLERSGEKISLTTVARVAHTNRSTLKSSPKAMRLVEQARDTSLS